jgi:hypothetical protein
MPAELVPMETSQPPQWLEPSGFIEEATRVADQLRKVIEDQKLYAVMGTDQNGRPRKHIVVEAWQTLAAMHQVYPLIEWTRPTDDFVPRIVVTDWFTDARGKKRKEVTIEQIGQGGWAARCVVTNRDGNPIGGAEAECRYEEERWRDRDSYSLRSMAQTRAISKALRGTLAYIVTLAGYNTTPAEEMVIDSPPPPRDPVTIAKKKVLELAGDDTDTARRVWENALENLDLLGGDFDPTADTLGKILLEAERIITEEAAIDVEETEDAASVEEEAWSRLVATLGAGPPREGTVAILRRWIGDLDRQAVDLGVWEPTHLAETLRANELPALSAVTKPDLETFAHLYCDLAKKASRQADDPQIG